METAAQKIERLKAEIKQLETQQQFCQHQFGEVKYDPIVEKEPRNNYSKGLQGQGSDPYYEIIFVDVTKPRWSKTCIKCGKVAYAYKEEVVKTITAPKFD